MRLAYYAAALLLAACSSQEDRVVARVGHSRITVAEYEQMAAKLLAGPYQHLRQIDQEARRKLLDAMVARELLVQLALNAQLDRDSTIARQVSRLEEGLLLKALYDREAGGQGDLSDPEVELYFYERGFDQEIRVQAISCGTAAEAEDVLAALRRGVPFETLASESPRQPPGSGPAGDLGFIPPPDLLPEVRQQLLSLEPGQVYPAPLATRYGLQVVKVAARREARFAARKPQLAERLRREKRAARVSAYTDSLRERAGLTCSTAAIDRLAGGPAGMAPDESLCTWTGGALSADEFRGYERPGPDDLAGQAQDSDAAALRKALEQAATRKLVLAEARRQGYLDGPVRTQVRQQRDELMVARLFAQITREVAVTEEQVHAYYQAHPEEYGSRSAVDVREILVADSELAERLRQRVLAGEEMEVLADQYNTREATRQRRGQMQLWRRENAILGPLAPAALDAPIGQLCGPLEVPGGYSLFRVSRRIQLPARPLEEVRQGILAMLKPEQQNEAMDRLLADLRAKNEAAIAVDPEVLASTLRDWTPTVPGVDSGATTGL